MPTPKPWSLELIAWIVCSLFVAIILLPVLSYSKDYPFIIQNILLIVILFTASRFVFTMPFVPYLKNSKVRLLLLFLIPALIIAVLRMNSKFSVYMQNNSLANLYDGFTWEDQQFVSKYIRTEMTFFGIGSLISLVLLGLRIIKSLWRSRNNKGI